MADAAFAATTPAAWLLGGAVSTWPPGPGVNCSAGETEEELQQKLQQRLATSSTTTLISALISCLGCVYVLLFAARRCAQRRRKQMRSGVRPRWSEWCATHSTTIVVLNVIVCSFLLSLVLIAETSWNLYNISDRRMWQLHDAGACRGFAFVVQLLQWAIMCWNVCISIVYTNVGSRHKKWIFVTASAAIAWTLSLVMAVLPWTADVYGISPLDWCWIQRDKETLQRSEWIYFYAEVLVCLVIVFVCFMVNLIKLARRTMGMGWAKGHRGFTRTMFFPLAFLLSYMGGIVNVINEQTNGCPSVALSTMHVISYGLQGCFFAIAFVVTQNGLPRCMKRCLRSDVSAAEEKLFARPMSFAGMQVELPSSDPHVLQTSYDDPDARVARI